MSVSGARQFIKITRRELATIATDIHLESSIMSLRVTIWLFALLFSSCVLAQETYWIDGKQYENVGYPSSFLVQASLVTVNDGNGNQVDTDEIFFKVTAPYAYSSFHVTVTNWFWNWTTHHYGNNGVTTAGTFVDGLTFSATNDSFGWQASENDFWSSQERGGAPLSQFFSVRSSSFSTSTEFAYSFDRLVPIPEPETYAMLLAGLGLLGLTARRRRAKLIA